MKYYRVSSPLKILSIQQSTDLWWINHHKSVGCWILKIIFEVTIHGVHWSTKKFPSLRWIFSKSIYDDFLKSQKKFFLYNFLNIDQNFIYDTSKFKLTFPLYDAKIFFKNSQYFSKKFISKRETFLWITRYDSQNL